MKKILIAKAGVAYGATIAAPTTKDAAVTPDLLAAGSIGIYGFHRYADGFQKFALITEAAATAGSAGSYKAIASGFNGDAITLYVGAGNGEPRQSSTYQLKGIRRLVGFDKETGTAEVVTITPPALPSVKTAYDSYFLRIEKRGNHNPGQRWSFNAVGNFAALSNLATALVAEINNRANVPFTAAVSGDNVVVTAKVKGESFTYTFDDFLLGATKVVTTPANAGIGTYAQLQKAESNYKGEQGWFDTLDPRMKSIAPLATDDEYDVYILDCINTTDAKHEQNATNTVEETLILFIPDASAQGASIEVIFGLLNTAGKLGVAPQFNSAAATDDEVTT